MKWFHAGAVLTVLSISSYAWGAPAEAQLGKPLAAPAGRPAAGKPANLPAIPKTSGRALGRALDRLQPEAQAATRGAAETRVYQRAAPAVVLVIGDEGFGSGALISADGKIVTNLHVVGDADVVGVAFKPAIEGATPGKADVLAAKVVRRDEVTDLALLQVAEVPAGVTPLALGNSTTVEVGADVHAIGHPTGEAWTYTRGIVSQIRRAYAWATEDKIPHEATVIQTQTPINPGNSGGPLLDENAAIVGINSFVGDGEGMNYAISAEDVKSFLARTEDRISHTARASAETCEAVVLDERPSTDPKGVMYGLDMNCDGKSDALMVTPDNKREATTLLMDVDFNGVSDTLYIDNDRDGDPDVALYDTDENGEPDLRGFFRKGEDEPYKWEKMQER